MFQTKLRNDTLMSFRATTHRGFKTIQSLNFRPLSSHCDSILALNYLLRGVFTFIFYISIFKLVKRIISVQMNRLVLCGEKVLIWVILSGVCYFTSN